MLWQSLLICLPFIICEFKITMLMNKIFVSFNSGMPLLFPLKKKLTAIMYSQVWEHSTMLRACFIYLLLFLFLALC